MNCRHGRPAALAQRRAWQEVVADEHAEEHKVVDDALHVKPERQRQPLKLQA